MAEPVNRFAQTKQTQRSAKPTANTGEVSESLRVDPNQQSCKLCDNFDDEEMVQCDNDECRLWYHFACVGVTREQVDNVFWVCNDCLKEVSGERFLQPNAENKSTKSSRSSKTQKSRTSAAKRQQLALERIEEERQLREAREKEYLDKKYSTLLEKTISSESDAGSDRTDVADQVEQYTADWVKNVDLRFDQASDQASDQALGQVKATDIPTAVSSNEHRQRIFAPAFWQKYHDDLKRHHGEVVGQNSQSQGFLSDIATRRNKTETRKKGMPP